MAGEHESVLEMWKEYLVSIGESVTATGKKFTSWYFASTEAGANELSELVLAGGKRATTSLFYAYGHEGSPLPGDGDYRGL